MSTPTQPPQPTPSSPPQSAPAPAPPPDSHTTKVMAILLSVVLAILAAFIAFSITRHFGAEPLIALGSAGVTLVATFNMMLSIVEKLGQL